jgi:hypothetical protein
MAGECVFVFVFMFMFVGRAARETDRCANGI